MDRPQQLKFEFYPTMNVTADLIDALRDAVAASGLSREQIADKMNEVAVRYGVSLTQGSGKLGVDTLEKWLNPTETSRAIPVKALPIFCAVTNCKTPLDVIARPIGYAVIDAEDAKLLAWAKASQKARKAQAELKRLEREIS